MLKYLVFLKWWLFATLVLVGGIFAFKLGVVEDMFERDNTKLTFLIAGLFVVMSLWCGVKSFWVSHALFKGTLDHRKEKFEQLEETGWFVSELCLTIGMVGTVCGFIMMLASFSNIDISNSKTVTDLIANLGTGMATALYTTLAGLIASALLKVQYFNLGQAIATAVEPELEPVLEPVEVN